MKILVTGGAGFIGSHLVDELLKLNHKVIVIDNLSSGKIENVNKRAKFYKIDIQSPKISEIFKKERPEIIFHLAAQVNIRESVKNPKKDARINILGSLNLLQCCKKFKVKKIIFASSGGAVYGQAKVIPTKETQKLLPQSPYGIAKMATEKYLEFFGKNYGLDWISLRLSNVYGPRQRGDQETGVVAIFCKRLLKTKPIIIFGSGRQTRDFLYVKDAISAFVLVSRIDTRNFKKRCFNIGTQKETSINKLLNLISKILNIKPKVKKEEKKEGDVFRSCLDITLAKKFFGWEPKYSLEKGLKETIDWFKAF
jgi:UDP-glucose 4-epimerase